MAKTPYNPGEIEPEVQKQWEREDAFRVVEDAEKEKFYCLFHAAVSLGRLAHGTCP